MGGKQEQIAVPLGLIGTLATLCSIPIPIPRPLTATFPSLSHPTPFPSLFVLAIMASVAGRKKSIIATTQLQIDTPVTNTLLNKSASQSTSLYQQCSLLRARL